jgi:Flp pilus assembly protein TadD/TolB-like protein
MGSRVQQASPNLRQADLVAVDVVGFPRDSEDDQRKLAQAYTALTARLEGAAQRHGGRIVGHTAEGFLLDFAAADPAMAAAEEIATGPWPPVHVGVHQATVMAMPGGEILGEAVPLVWRIMNLAEPGAVIASDAVRRSVQNHAVSHRLMRLPEPLTTATPGEIVALHRLSYIQPVDPADQQKTNRRIGLIAAAVAVVAVGAVWVLFGRDIVTTLVPKHDHVAVLRLASHGGSRAAADFADGLTDEIGYVLKTGGVLTVPVADADKLRGADRDGVLRREQVGAVLDGSVAGSAANLDIKLRIDDPVHHLTLWSHEFTGGGDDLKTQVSSRVVSVLTCSARALSPDAKVGGPQVLTLYLKFCDLDSEAAADTGALIEEERILRQLTSEAPEFTYGHSNLANFLISKSQIDAADSAALREEARTEADRALALDLKNSDGYVARARLVAPPGWDKREKNLTLALTMPAPGADPRIAYAQMLPEVGRLGEASDLARKGARLSPWDADNLSFSAQLLAQVGRSDDADLALTTALQMAPTNPVVQTFRYHIYQWLGRWEDALRLINDDANRPAPIGQEDDLDASRAFMKAMKSTDTAVKVAARDAEFAAVRHDRSHLMVALSHLSALGFTDDAFRLASEVPPSAASDDMTVLFAPLMDPLRRDPRFIALAGRLGLVDYWTRAGKWPDFCSAADLPYSCNAEAQKLAAS